MSVNLYLGISFAVIWTLSFIFTQIALGSYPPLWLAGIRLIIAGSTLYFILKIFFKKNIVFNIKIILAGIFSQSIYLGASYWSLTNMPTSIVNIVVSTVPMFSV
ncbi:MAG: EamA family transporter, partial [Thermodesulfobacteriota bacterium]